MWRDQSAALPQIDARGILRDFIPIPLRVRPERPHLQTREPPLDLTKSSFDFHCGLESPFVFFRREWRAIAIFGGGFCLLMLMGVAWLDPSFFYPRLQTDPLLYYLKAKALVDSGNTAARLAVNSRPFPYAAMPGVLRAPALFAFRDFDDQWRAIQVLNIPIVAGFALMSAYILSWTQPVRRHWMTVAFAFAFVALSPMWITNVYAPLADAPYAAFTLLAILICIRILCRQSPGRSTGLLVISVVLFIVAFLLRFTGPVLLIFAAALGRGRWSAGGLSRRVKRSMFIVPLVLLIALVWLNSQAIFGRYLAEPFTFVKYGDKSALMLNLMGVALPDQIMPDFHLAFSQPPIIDIFHGRFGRTPVDAAWTVLGIAMSATLIFGLWRSRSRMFPEILYVVAPLPVLALMMPSTSRYLMSYQPFLWLFFFEGVSVFWIRLKPLVPIARKSRLIIGASAIAVMVTAGALRWYRVAGTGADRSFAVSMNAAPAYIGGVSTTFRSLRNFLETLPKDRTLLIGSAGTVGRWTAIANRSYYVPDSALVSIASNKEVYLIVECGTLEYCQSFSEWKNHLEERLCYFGEFSYTPVFSVRSNWARAEVFRVEPST